MVQFISTEIFGFTTESLFENEFPEQRDKILEKYQEMCFILVQNTPQAQET